MISCLCLTISVVIINPPLGYSQKNEDAPLGKGHPLVRCEMLEKNPLRTRRFLFFLVEGCDPLLCNETRFIAVGSHKLQYYLY